jgi:hypothetical protein
MSELKAVHPRGSALLIRGKMVEKWGFYQYNEDEI